MTDLLKYLGKRVKDGKEFMFGYIDYRGEYSQRRAIATLLWFGHTEFHTNDQWLLDGMDLDKEVMRSFAVSEIGVKDEELRAP